MEVSRATSTFARVRSIHSFLTFHALVVQAYFCLINDFQLVIFWQILRRTICFQLVNGVPPDEAQTPVEMLGVSMGAEIWREPVLPCSRPISAA